MLVLGALLLNPPVAGGARTARHLQMAAELLGCDVVEIANLFATPTRDVTVMNQLGRTPDGWEAARPRLRDVIRTSDCLLAGWGVSGLYGQSAHHRQAQLEFISQETREAGKQLMWTLNGEPRHPSRWHQYVSDRHGRAVGESLSDRLSTVLMSVPFTSLCPAGSVETS